MSEKRQRAAKVNVRCTNAEKDIVERRAAEQRLSVSDFVRAVMIESVPIGVTDQRYRLPSETRATLSALARALNELSYEVGKIGVNINQIAAAANRAILADLPVNVNSALLGKLLAAVKKVERQHDEIVMTIHSLVRKAGE